ncbi:nicotinamide/nicotinic acid mononucleotide adenylyltransferase 1 isoform X3 [Halyomorpha halys]|uniref:nicotinamide/nicotinic acid mononucleotide adenylyltransferase 1 isoform X3 n=1 Tax=Halyomorpha halys TaxID=286706 RepID=UPI0006D4E3DC
MTKTKIVLLACGSFNPPTHMHLRMFELARDHINRVGTYQVVGGIISPVHDGYNKKELIASTHRCTLIKLALQDSEWIHLSDWECNQESWTPTRQTLQYHQNKINAALSTDDNMDNNKNNDNEDPSWVRNIRRYQTNEVNVLVKLLCGADLLQSFSSPGLWKESDIETIIGDHGLAVITRAGTDPHKFVYESDVLTKFSNNIHIITEWITNEVSSTKIRRSLRRGESVKYLVADSVIDYIKNHCLYGSLDNKYHMYTNSSLYHLTPSPSDLIMGGIDTPDSGNDACMPSVKRIMMYVGCNKQLPAFV